MPPPRRPRSPRGRWRIPTLPHLHCLRPPFSPPLTFTFLFIFPLPSLSFFPYFLRFIALCRFQGPRFIVSITGGGGILRSLSGARGVAGRGRAPSLSLPPRPTALQHSVRAAACSRPGRPAKWLQATSLQMAGRTATFSEQSRKKPPKKALGKSFGRG